MNNKISNVLLKLINSGYEAYVIGGFVRDYILGIETYDVDITTNASPSEIMEIFELNSSNEDNYGRICIKDSLYNYDITTYREELKYENRKPIDYKFISSIEDDIKRRDFTINALYMDCNGKIYDVTDGVKDINDRIIRVIGNINDKMVEDPLRLLRAIRFASLLDFEIEENLVNYIKQNKQLIRTLSYDRRKEELDIIFKNQNKLKGINLIKEYNLMDVLEIGINDDIKYTENPLGIWAQINIAGEYNFSNNEQEKIDAIKNVLKYGKIDNVVLYQYGLYVCIIAGEILEINRSIISELYKELPIYSSKDIVVNGEDIMEILNIEPSEKIKDILFDIEINILNRALENDYENIKEFLLNNWR